MTMIIFEIIGLYLLGKLLIKGIVDVGNKVDKEVSNYIDKKVNKDQ